MIGRDGPSHRGDDLGVDEDHARRLFPCAEHEMVGVKYPSRVLVAAVALVEDLQDVGPWVRRRVGRLRVAAVPVGAAVVVEVGELVRDGSDAGAGVGEREAGPVGEVGFGGRAVRGQISECDFGECRVSVESSSV